jgi:hypothetical protein
MVFLLAFLIPFVCTIACHSNWLNLNR